MTSERARVDRLARVLAAPGAAGVRLGIGDDAAVLDRGADPLVWTIDAQVDGVHFRRAWLPLEDVGYRAVMAAASDLAAMGARPRGVLAALVLPSAFTDDELEALARGQAEAAARFGIAVVGGNLARGGELSITTTVLGEAAVPLRRDGARAGDEVLAAGALGVARAGLEALVAGDAGAATADARAAWRRPQARLDDGLRAAIVATAAIDVSDGLAIDASRLAEASGVRVVLDAGAVRAAGGAALARAAAALGHDPLELATAGGEDYALVVTVPPGTRIHGFERIGACEAGSGVALRDGATTRELAAVGFDHFAP